ncbi:MAG: efflux RND transporter permease subunit, partial [Fusobacteriaceae bacterium]
MGMTEFAMKNKVSTYLLIGLVCFFGVFAFFASEKAEDPGFTVKTAIITTNWEGATAEQVANLVSKKIEQEVRTMESLDYIYSKNVAGQSNV